MVTKEQLKAFAEKRKTQPGYIKKMKEKERIQKSIQRQIKEGDNPNRKSTMFSPKKKK